jgi:hypothetical protein
METQMIKQRKVKNMEALDRLWYEIKNLLEMLLPSDEVIKGHRLEINRRIAILMAEGREKKQTECK